jgi:NAD+ synthase
MESGKEESGKLSPKFKTESIDVIKMFIQLKIEESKADGVILGLSGGLDSAVVAKLCADVLGPKKVFAFILPDGETCKEDVDDAVEFASELGIEYKKIDIAEPVSSFQKVNPTLGNDLVALGNIKARCRMIIIYSHANSTNRIVMGTGNKSELLTGYFTKFGDGGADFLPIGDLYKTQVRELARNIGVPDNVIKKIPCAGLWEGQTDEKELGIRYEDLDRILLGIELKMAPEAISDKIGIPKEKVLEILDKVKRSVHKRKMPLIPKIGIRTIGLDWRE